jgi:hypothetical protein
VGLAGYSSTLNTVFSQNHHKMVSNAETRPDPTTSPINIRFVP